MSSTRALSDDPYTAGTRAISHDLRVTIPAAQAPGAYVATLTYTATAAP